MEDRWVELPASDVEVGDRIQHRGHEFVVARIDPRFLNRDNMVCFVEHTPERWHAYPAGLDQAVLVHRDG